MIGGLGVKATVVVGTLALVVGFGAGCYTSSQFAKANQFESVTEARHESAQDIQRSVETSLATEQKVTDSAKQVAVIRKAVSARVQPKISETQNANDPLTCPDIGLDIGTVRMLNSARDGVAIDPASLGDGASKAPSGIGMPELLDNDLEVVGLYRELATRHDALVDYVESIIQKQADQ